MRTYNSEDLQGYILKLFNQSMQQPWTIDTNFGNFYICLGCDKLYKEKAVCECDAPKAKKKRKKRINSKNKKSRIAKAVMPNKNIPKAVK